MCPEKLTHTDDDGAARMVDVGEKESTAREAVAVAECSMQLRTAEAIRSNEIKKGDVLSISRVAGIMAAKKTDSLIPLCHQIPLSSVSIDFSWPTPSQLRILATVKCVGKTGVEMEALVAATTAALTIYDMCKAIDRQMRIGGIEVLSKSGGKSGPYVKSESEQR